MLGLQGLPQAEDSRDLEYLTSGTLIRRRDLQGTTQAGGAKREFVFKQVGAAS